MTTTPEPTRCRSRSEYGDCGRPGKHDGPHAVPIGPDFWFGYTRNGRRVTMLGYGHLRGDTFEPVGGRSAWPTYSDTPYPNG